MTQKKFKTNIKCSGCVAQVSPFLNAESSIQKWEVNLEDADKILTVDTEASSSQKILEAVQKAGYQAQEIQ